jgi:PKD repeat protein
LKVRKDDMNVRELFKTKLENSEVIPEDSVRDELMRKLQVKEFVHFNPSRFNIYYSGLILAGAIASILIITSAPSPDKDQGSKTMQNIEYSQTSNSSKSAGKQLSDEKLPELSPTSIDESEKRPLKISEISIGVKNQGNISIIRNADSSGILSDSLIKKAAFAEDLSEKNNRVGLQKTIGAAFEASVTSGCAPLKVTFYNKSTSYDSTSWAFGDGGFSNLKDPEWIFDVAGEYKIVLTVFSSNGSYAVASSVIIVHPRPLARFETTPEKPVIPDDEIRFMNFSVDAVRYKWEFGDGNTSNSFEPYHRYRRYYKYDVRLIAWSEYGCSDSSLVKNAFSESGCFIDFPNAFMPGTDGPVGGYYSIKSDEAARIFHPITSGVTDYQLKIFSKKGILIFESNDINIGWDGYVKGQLCETGVYVWKVRGIYRNGEPFVKMGDVTLLRN